MGEFKIGDRVRRIGNDENNGMNVGDEGVILSIRRIVFKFSDGYYANIALDKGGVSVDNDIKNLQLVVKSKTMKNLLTIFKNLTVGEPDKTFIEAGIVDENRELTSDGAKVFLHWLLSKNGEGFKKEVADKIAHEKKMGDCNKL